MKILPKIILALSPFLALGSIVKAEEKIDPAKYLEDVFNFVKDNSIIASYIDWKDMQQKVFALAKDAKTTKDTYPAIKYLLKSLEDGHSFFIEPEIARNFFNNNQQGFGFEYADVDSFRVVTLVYSDSSAEKAGLQVGDRIVSGQQIDEKSLELVISNKNNAKVKVSIDNYNPFPPTQSKKFDDKISLLQLFAYTSNDNDKNRAYASDIQASIKKLDPETCGWIVDLRRDGGGAVWPKIAGLGPLLTEGKIGGYIDAQGKTETWFYRSGQAQVNDETVVAIEPYKTKSPAPVAVLLSPLTASAGEAVAIAFHGQAQARFFGQATAGQTTGNESKFLSDSAVISVAAALSADRNGQVFEGAVEPDEKIALDWTKIASDDDPVLQAASKWLKAQPACQR